jgi:hypothetical protein
MGVIAGSKSIIPTINNGKIASIEIKILLNIGMLLMNEA